MPFARGEVSDVTRSKWVKKIRSLAIILHEEFGVPFRFYEAATSVLLDITSPNDSTPELALAPAPSLEVALAIQLVASGGPRIERLTGERFQLALPFTDGEHGTTIAVGVIPALARTPAEMVQEGVRLGKWLRSVHDRLCIVSQLDARHRHGTEPEAGSTAGVAALLGLERLLRTQRIDKEPGCNRKQILQTVAEVLRVQTVVWIPPAGVEATIEGEALLSPWDCDQLARELAKEPDVVKTGYLINNHIRTSRFGARFPRVVSLLAVPIPTKSALSWMIALNKTCSASASSPGPEIPQDRAPSPDSSSDFSPAGTFGPAHFRRSDMVHLLPFAALLGVHLRAARRHQQYKSLMVGLTRSLAAAVDSRAAILSGHSERVARIAVELARELGLREEELSDVYLGGLLHDVGKLGVSDSILRKRDPLTADEFAHIRQHVTIGNKLLADLQPIAHLMPAVLHHHERYDGMGYPDGLRGDTIPFLARILAVAESYDAMIHLSPDRPEPSREHVEEILSRGADEQWDGRVIAAFFRCRDRIREILQRWSGESALHQPDKNRSDLPTFAADPLEPGRLGIAAI